MSTISSTITRRVSGRPITPPTDKHHPLPPLPKAGVCPIRSLALYTISVCFHYFNFVMMALARFRDRHYWATQAPTLTKSYPVRPSLTHRIHLPPDHTTSTTKYPTILLLHGGGWVIGSPSADDEQAHLLSQAGFVVVSLEYALAPWNRFPGPLNDIAALIPAVLSDMTLPIDKTRVVVAGFSAGATMALAVAQLPALRGDVIKAVVAVQPVTDFSEAHRGRAGPTPWGEADRLELMQPLFNWAYVPAGQDLRAPLLSPIFAGRAEIRAPVMVVTGGADMLCEEAGMMACRLAGKKGWRREVRGDWEDVGRGVRLLCVPGMPHCFTHFWVKPKGEWEGKKKAIVDGVWDEVVGWLGRTLELQEE